MKTVNQKIKELKKIKEFIELEFLLDDDFEELTFIYKTVVDTLEEFVAFGWIKKN